MKKHIITVILLILVVVLCIATVFLIVRTVSLRKSIDEMTEKSLSENLKMQENFSELKNITKYSKNIEGYSEDFEEFNSTIENYNSTIKNYNDFMSELLDGKNQLTAKDFFDIMGSGYKLVYKGETLEKQDTTVVEYTYENGYIFAYINNIEGVDTVTDIIIHKYSWRRYIVDTLLIPLHKEGTLTISYIKELFGEDDEETAIKYSGVKAYQWSLGDGYSYLVTEGAKIGYSMLVCPDGTIIDLYPTE